MEHQESLLWKQGDLVDFIMFNLSDYRAIPFFKQTLLMVKFEAVHSCVVSAGFVYKTCTICDKIPFRDITDSEMKTLLRCH